MGLEISIPVGQPNPEDARRAREAREAQEAACRMHAATVAGMAATAGAMGNMKQPTLDKDLYRGAYEECMKKP